MSMSRDEIEREQEDDEAARAIARSFMNGRALRPPMYGNKKVITVKLSSTALDGLRQIAERMGYMHKSQGNVSMLIEAIGTGTIKLAPPTY